MTSILRTDIRVGPSKYSNGGFVAFSRYQAGGGVALYVINADDGTFEYIASVNLEGVEVDADEIALKTWSENEGVYDALLAAQVVEEARRVIAVGSFVEAPVVRFTGPVRELLEALPSHEEMQEAVTNG